MDQIPNPNKLPNPKAQRGGPPGGQGGDGLGVGILGFVGIWSLGFWIFLASCAENAAPPAAPPPQIYSPADAATVARAQDPSSASAAAAARAAELLALLVVQDGQGVHGKYHQVKAREEQEFWRVAFSLAVFPGGDHLLALALERVYTRYDANAYRGPIWHYPYLNSRKAAALADKLLREYPASALAEIALWLKGFALRCPPLEEDEGLARSFENTAEQMRWKPDLEGARRAFSELAARFPAGRYARASRALAAAQDLVVDLPDGPFAEDPRGVGP